MASYYVYVASGERWSLESEHPDKGSATNHASHLSGKNQHDGVKVTDAPAGSGKEKVVFIRERSTKAQTANPIDYAPICADTEDFFKFDARKALGRLLRKFLDEQVMTGIELLYSSGHLRLIQRTDTLYNQAVGMVAQVQSKQSGQPIAQRSDLLYKTADQVVLRAKKAQDMQPKYVEIVKKGGLPALAQSLANEPAVRRDYFFRCGVAGWIGTTREWTGKLALLLDHLDKGGLTPDIVVTIDEVMAEVLDGADSVKEVLGAQRDLSGALRTVTQVASGHYVGLRGAPPLLERITKALKRGDMPLTQGVLYERVQRALSGIQQLTREGSGDTEKAAFKGLVADLCLQGVMSGGPDVAVGVTNRARIVLAQGNDLTVDKAIQEVAKLLPSGGARLSYLLELGRSSLAGGDHGQTIVKHLDAAVPALPAGRALFPEKLDAPAVQRAAGALRAVAAAVALEGAWKSAVGGKLQGV